MALKFSHKEWNPHKSAMETWYWDSDTEQFTIRNTFHVGDVLEQNKRAANSSLDQRFGKEMLHHVAEIPMGMVVKFKKDHNLDVFSNDPAEQKRLRRLLEQPEYRYLKTTNSKLWRPT